MEDIGVNLIFFWHDRIIRSWRIKFLECGIYVRVVFIHLTLEVSHMIRLDNKNVLYRDISNISIWENFCRYGKKRQLLLFIKGFKTKLTCLLTVHCIDC